MEIEGLTYNTQRERLRLKAYGRDIQQMVDYCIALPTKQERQKCAASIIDAMKRVVPSQLSYKERMPALWYHLALMSDFRLDIDYPVEIVHEDKMATSPETIEYDKRRMPVRHYGRMLFDVFEMLKTMPDGEERRKLAEQTATQMYRCLEAWGMGTIDREKVVDDLARYTDGVIQMEPSQVVIGGSTSNTKNQKRKK